jgi:hypothetical protein
VIERWLAAHPIGNLLVFVLALEVIALIDLFLPPWALAN